MRERLQAGVIATLGKKFRLHWHHGMAGQYRRLAGGCDEGFPEKMPKRSTSGTGNTDLAVAQFLSEYARYLLAAGLSYSQFIELARSAYFKAASESATFRNRRVNQSAVAAMTGLTRVQVRELATRGAVSAVVKQGRIARIIEGWTTDPRFLKADFSPRRLSLVVKPGGFADLVRRYGGDIPPRATLREMARNQYVSMQGQFVRLDPKAHETRAQGRLRHISDALAALVSGSQSDADPPYAIRTLSREITYCGTSAKGRILMQKRTAESLRAFLTELQAAGNAVSIESPPNRKQNRLITRTRVLLVSEEMGAQA